MDSITTCCQKNFQFIDILLIFGFSLIFGMVTTLILKGLNDWFELDKENKFIPEVKDENDIKSANKNELEKKRSKIIQFLNISNGIIEVFLYSVSFLVGVQIFVAFWIGVKTALRWDYEKRAPEHSECESQIEGKYYNMTKFLYLRFLIGNALNIGFSYLIATIIKNGWIIF